jgi:hypothetical protein
MCSNTILDLIEINFKFQMVTLSELQELEEERLATEPYKEGGKSNSFPNGLSSTQWRLMATVGKVSRIRIIGITWR